ncbi:putative ribonuclease H-like domain-containing protein [Tanacetum coccineum]
MDYIKLLELDDIIFGLIKKELCKTFEKLMHEKFQMSSMGELTFFQGLRVQQKKDGIFISQDKYVVEILKKFGFTEVKTASTLMETQNPLLKDEDVCACARYQVNPKVSHLHVVKRIFRYLKGQPKLGLWYPKDSPFDLVAYTDSDYAGASLDRKSTTGGCQFLGCRLISWQCKKQTVVANSTTKAKYVAASSCCGQVLWIQNQLLDYGYNFMHTKIFIDNNRKAKKSVRLMMEKLFRMELELMPFWSSVKAKTINGEVQLHALVDGKKIIVTESTVRRELQLEDAEGIDCLPTLATIFEQLALMRLVQVFLDQQLEGRTTHKRVYIAPFHTKKIFGNMKMVGKGFSGRVTSLFPIMLTLKPRKLKRKDTQVPQPSGPTDIVIDKVVHKELGDSLVRAATTASSLEVVVPAWVESSGDEHSLGKDASKQGRRINVIDVDEDITLVNVQDDADNEMFDVNALNGEEVFVVGQNENVVEEVVDVAQDKGKVIMVEEPVKTMKKKDLIRLDEEIASKLQAEFDEEERLAREKAEKEQEANVAMIEE